MRRRYRLKGNVIDAAWSVVLLVSGAGLLWFYLVALGGQ